MALVFDVSADMAIFRKAYTTTSQISFAFPPPTAIGGLICAIAGIDHHDAKGEKSAVYWDSLSGTRIAISIRRPVRWLPTAVNLLKFKSSNGSLGEHIQSRHQFLKKPSYRIYVEGGSIYGLLKQRLEQNEFVYTPFLGAAYALADIDYRGEFPAIALEKENVKVDTILPEYPRLEVDLLKSNPLHREVVPFQLDSQRSLQELVGVFYTEVRENKECSDPASIEEYRSLPIWVKSTGSVVVNSIDEQHVAWFQPFA